MRPFTDIFVIQIIGLLRNRRFSGDCNFLIGSLPTQLQFSEGFLINTSHEEATKDDELTKTLWVNRGEIELASKTYTATGLDFSSIMEQAIIRSSPSMPESCLFMQNLSLEKSKLNIQDESSSFADAEQAIYNNVRSGGSDLAQARGNLSVAEFWKGLFYLTGSGKLIGDYGKNLSILLLKIQSDVIANLQKTLGKKAADLYQDRLSQDMDDRWPNTPKHKNYDRIYGAYDRIYGTAPYRTWAKLLGETTAKVASSALGNACYKKALSLLHPVEAVILQQLFN